MSRSAGFGGVVMVGGGGGEGEGHGPMGRGQLDPVAPPRTCRPSETLGHRPIGHGHTTSRNGPSRDLSLSPPLSLLSVARSGTLLRVRARCGRGCDEDRRQSPPDRPSVRLGGVAGVVRSLARSAIGRRVRARALIVERFGSDSEEEEVVRREGVSSSFVGFQLDFLLSLCLIDITKCKCD
ncbi:hypothetical protein NL676_023086 [Syzygium grande]|nr:hypothetical protein NL676_023086 [Syzygium grande]